MVDSFMITEGDRSGTNTPSRMEKSKSAIVVGEARIQRILRNWENLSLSDLNSELDESIKTLRTARALLTRVE